jgi:hypothetical protein
MKFLDDPSLIPTNEEIKAFNRGDLVIHSRLELYSCKDTNKDRKLRKSLLPELRKDANSGLSSVPSSPMLQAQNPSGNDSNVSLQETKGERLCLDFIRTLNIFYGAHDYDFSYARPRHFTKKTSRSILENLDHVFSHDLVLGKAWTTINKVMKVDECSVFQFFPDPEPDALVHFCYLIYCSKQKQILAFAGHGHSTVHMHGNANSGMYHDLKTESQHARSPFRTTESSGGESSDGESDSDEYEEQDISNVASSQGLVDAQMMKKIEHTASAVPTPIKTVIDVPATKQFSTFAVTRGANGQLMVTPSPSLCPTQSPMANMIAMSPDLKHTHSGSSRSSDLSDFSL